MAAVALDLTGGDHAPVETLAGALAAAEDGIDVVLVGDEGALPEPVAGAGPPFAHTTEVVGRGEDPAVVRARPAAGTGEDELLGVRALGEAADLRHARVAG